MHELPDRWAADLLVLSPGADPAAVRTAGTDLLRRWAEPHRHYHRTQHLTEFLGALGELAAAGEVAGHEGVLARVAAWFHDAMYAVPDPSGNERASAELAARTLQALGCAAADVAAVGALVRASERHDRPAAGGAEAAFHDADLWILSAPAGRFDDYCEEVRDEYAMVPDAAYAVGRVAVLRPFVDRDAIYATPHARAGWEAPARTNLTRELCRLGSADRPR